MNKNNFYGLFLALLLAYTVSSFPIILNATVDCGDGKVYHSTPIEFDYYDLIDTDVYELIYTYPDSFITILGGECDAIYNCSIWWSNSSSDSSYPFFSLNRTIQWKCLTTTTTMVEPLMGTLYAGNVSGLGNSTGTMDEHILGMHKTNFLKIIGLGMVTITVLGIGFLDSALGIMIGLAMLDAIVLILAWFTIPVSFLAALHVIGLSYWMGEKQ